VPEPRAGAARVPERRAVSDEAGAPRHRAEWP
jgi:hypothetical protein